MIEADVAILGAGLAGLSLAAHLRDASVVVLEAAPAIGAGCAGREDGWVRPGLLEHPGSLVAALGPAEAAEIYRLGLRTLEAMVQRGRLTLSGALVLAAAPGEDAETLEADAGLLSQMGLPAGFLGAAEVERALGVAGLGPGRLERLVGWVEPGALLEGLAAEAAAAGAGVHLGARVERVLPEGQLHRLIGPELELRASVVVYAAGASLCELDPFFAETVLPFRQSHLIAPGALALPVVAGHGLIRARPHPQGALLSGARWATPHLEAWERDAGVVPAPVEAALLRFGRALCPELGEPVARWASIQAHTCDNLPLVGPLPGRATALALTGWGGQDLALALPCGVAMAEALVRGGRADLPACFSPSRLI